MRPARATVLIVASCLFVEAATSTVYAVDFRGDARVGYYTRQVEFQGEFLGETSGETNNDEQVVNLQLRAQVENLDDSKDRLLFDFRDKRDSYGLLERENLRLTNYDRRELRTAAFQRPWESNRLYFTAGRFSLPEANILGNDGAEVGYRTSKTSRYGLFAGQAVKAFIAPLYVDPDTRDLPGTQFGAYFNYEEHESPEDSTYLSNALAQAPSYDITDAENHFYYYNRGLLTFDSVHRVGTLVQFDFSPKASLRRGYVSYYYQTDRLRAGGYVNQITTEDYLIKQDVQDALEPSPIRTLDFDLRYRFGASFAVDAAASQGTRTADGLSRTEYSAGLLFPKVLGDSSSTRLQLGIRDNFQSKDKFTKLAYDYWGKSFSFGVGYTISDEDYDDGTKNKRTILMVDAGIYILTDIRGSIGYEQESDDKVEANALFIMFGYRFGSQVSAPRTRPARFEDM